ncbi:MAG: hypothetical protein U9R01_00735 [candidate division WOR-3 bacterium]|nr:hypothetical protein [candidate division WOR-3 bacterium]
MGQRKGKIFPVLLAIIVGVMILALSIIPIPRSIKSVVQYILIGIFVSGGIIGWELTENKRSKIIANTVLWCAIIAAIIITLI